MAASRIVLAISGLLWGWFVLTGWSGIQSIADQRVPGYPNAGQIQYYLIVPLAALGLSALLFGLTWLRRAGCLLAAAGAALIAALPFYLVFYTGGV